jgi:hypothetical protein
VELSVLIVCCLIVAEIALIFLEVLPNITEMSGGWFDLGICLLISGGSEHLKIPCDKLVYKLHLRASFCKIWRIIIL